VQVVQCIGGTVYMLYVWYWRTCGIVCMSSMLCYGHAILCMCIMYSWYCGVRTRCVVLFVVTCIGWYCTSGIDDALCCTLARGV